jgi:hypothetical protein
MRAIEDPNPHAVVLDVLYELRDCWIRRPAVVFYVNELEKLCKEIEWNLGFKPLSEPISENFQPVDTLADVGIAVSDTVFVLPNLTIVETKLFEALNDSKVMKGNGQVKIPSFLNDIFQHWMEIFRKTNHEYMVVQLESLELLRDLFDLDKRLASSDYDPGDDPWRISGGRAFISPFKRTATLGIYLKRAWSLPPERRKYPNRRFVFTKPLLKQDYKYPVTDDRWLKDRLLYGLNP